GLRTEHHTDEHRRYDRNQSWDHHFLDRGLGDDIDARSVIRFAGAFHDALDRTELPPHFFHDQPPRFTDRFHTQRPEDEGQHAAEEKADQNVRVAHATRG